MTVNSSSVAGDEPPRVLYVNTPEDLPGRVNGALEDVELASEVVDRRATAVDAVLASPVHCVVTEHELPDGDAVDLAASLREEAERLPIILFTGQGSEEIARAATAAGVTEYLPTQPGRDDADLLAGRIRTLAEQERDRRATERERNRLVRKSDHLQSLVESAPLAIVELDATGEVLRWNCGAEQTFGLASDEVIGEFNPIVPDEQHEEFEELMEWLLDGNEVRGKEMVGQTKSDQRIDFLLSAAPVSGAEGEIRSVTWVLNDITAQKQLEQRLRQLQETAQQLNVSPSIEEIAEIATEAAAEVLGLEVTALWRYEERENALVPTSYTSASEEEVGEIPRFEPKGSLAWEVFETGELRAYDDLQNVADRYNPETSIRSEVLVPLGEHGVLVTGSPQPKQFSEMDIDLFRILGATVEAAFDRASREETLRRQNERLDEFADMVAHDLRNPLMVADGFLEMAEESGDPEQFERVASALDRINQLIDDLLTLARGEVSVDDVEPVDLSAVARESWKLVDTEDATLDVRDPPTVMADSGRLRQLFENLFRNAVEHGCDTATVTIGALPDDEGFYVEDDGVGIPEDQREIVFDHGVSFGDEGTGFGLSIVADIARAHGWCQAVTQSDEGGARFEFTVDDVSANSRPTGGAQE
jgi:PAS domain S-box-containing protein